MTSSLFELQSDKITIFDIKMNDLVPENSASPYARKVIFGLQVKKLPFHVELVELIDISAVSKALGVKPTNDKPPYPFYTLPAIYDPSTKTAISDSLPILQYLDAQYPDTPALVPKGTEGLVKAFDAITLPLSMKLITIVVPATVRLFAGTKSETFFRETRETFFGVSPIESLAPTNEAAAKIWEEIKAIFDDINSWYGDVMFMMRGDHPTYADIQMAGRLWWYRGTFGVESEEWKRVASWHEGRWAKMIGYFDAKAKENHLLVL